MKPSILLAGNAAFVAGNQAALAQLLTGPGHAEQAIGQIRRGGDGDMDSLRQSRKVPIKSEDGNSSMTASPSMVEWYEIAAVAGNKMRDSTAAKANTSVSGTDAFAFPASSNVGIRTGWPIMLSP